MLDAQAILDQARAGNAPAAWHVYHARVTFFRRRGLYYTAACLASIVAGVALLVASYVRFHAQGLCAFPCVLLYVLGYTWISGRLAITYGRIARSGAPQLLVLTPEGFVMQNGPHTLTVPYHDYKRFTMHRGPWNSYGIMSEDVGYGTRAWRIDARFDDPGAIARRIVADQAAYVAEYGWAGWRHVPPPQQIEVSW